MLATAIAETSITIDGVRIVIDSGLQRLPVFEASTGITRLETVRASCASIDQRAGRAGRTQPGIAVRLWRREQTAALPAFTPPQITASDLSTLLLDCTAWGVTDPASLRFIDPPPSPSLSEARTLLRQLGALDERDALTATGEKMRDAGLPVREAAMMLAAAQSDHDEAAARLAVLMGERGLGGASIDLDRRLRAFAGDESGRATKARDLAARTARSLGAGGRSTDGVGAGALMLHGFSDRVARNRGPAGDGRQHFRLANGCGAFVEDHDPLAAEPFLVVSNLTGKPQSQRILAAARVDLEDIERDLADRIADHDETFFDKASRQVKARRRKKLDSLVLAKTALPRPSGEPAAAALCDGVRQIGLAALPREARSRQLRDRLAWLNRTLGEPWPDMSDDALPSSLEDWFAPFQTDVTAFARIKPASLVEGLKSLVPYPQQPQLDRLAPTHFTAPTGSRLPIRYDGDEPVLAVRVQELFGLKDHPKLAGSEPLLLELLSPAQRPIQTTRDLPGFWAGSWADVRTDHARPLPQAPVAGRSGRSRGDTAGQAPETAPTGLLVTADHPFDAETVGQGAETGCPESRRPVHLHRAAVCQLVEDNLALRCGRQAHHHRRTGHRRAFVENTVGRHQEAVAHFDARMHDPALAVLRHRKLRRHLRGRHLLQHLTAENLRIGGNRLGTIAVEKQIGRGGHG